MYTTGVMSQCEKCGGNYSKRQSVYWSRS